MMRDPFVGREQELAELTEALEAAVEGHGCLVTIEGEPGIGKTRLAHELAALAAERGATTLWGRSYEGDRSIPYGPIVECLLAHARSQDDEVLLEQMGPGAPEILELLHPLKARLPGIEPPPRLEDSAARLRLFESVTTFVQRAGATPLLLVLDDLQWADRDSLALLGYLGRAIGGLRSLIVGLHRPDIPPALREVARDPVHKRVALDGLPAEDVADLVAGRIGVTSLEDRVRAHEMGLEVHRRTAGNPFFVGEVVRDLERRGALLDHRPAELLDRIGVPRVVMDVLHVRLEGLSEPCRRLLTFASALTGPSSWEALDAVTEVDQIDDVLGEATSSGILLEEPKGVFAFTHDLVREAVYGSVRLPERPGLHAHIASALQWFYGRRAGEHAGELAHHFFEGGEPAEAFRYSVRAAEHAQAALAYEEASGHCERALASSTAASIPTDELARLHALAGESFLNALRPAEAEEHLTRAMHLASSVGDARLLGRATLAWSTVLLLDPGGRSAAAELRESLELLGEREDALRSRLLAALSRDVGRDEHGMLLGRGDAGQVEPAREALELATMSRDPRAIREAVPSLVNALRGPGHIEEVRSLLERLGDAAETDARTEGVVRSVKAFLEALHGRMGGVENVAKLERGSSISENLLEAGPFGLQKTALALFRGRYAEAEQDVMEIFPRVLRVGMQSSNAAGALMSYLIDMRVVQGRLPELEPMLGWDPEQPGLHPLETGVSALARLQAGDRDAAGRFFASVDPDDLLEREDHRFLLTIEVVAWVGWELRDPRHAEVAYAALAPYAELSIVYAVGVLYHGSAHRTLGELAATLERWDEAASHFERAIEANARMGTPPWLAIARLGYAEVLVERGRPADRGRALELAEAALATFEELGMQKLAERTMDLLAELQGHAAAAGEARLCREGDYWTIAYEGATFRIRDLKGLGYIAHLVSRPGEEFHALELAAGRGEPHATAAAEGLAPETGHAGELLDPQAKQAYRTRLRDLEEEITEATSFADDARAAKLKAERDELLAQLAGAVGLGGRDRKAADQANRARLQVTKAIKRAVGNIERECPGLAGHLDGALRTGVFCSYRPEHPLTWSL